METDSLFPYPPDDPERVRSLSARCRRAATRCAGAADQLSRDQGLAAGSWRGPAAAACRAELGHTARLADRLPVPLHRAALALQRFAEALVRARAAIDGVRAGYEHEVAQQRSEVARLFADPAVPPQLRRLVADDLRWGQQQELGAYHRRYAAILAELEEQARAVGRSLESLAWSVLPDGSRPGGSPADAEPLLVGALPLLASQRNLLTDAAGIPVAGTAAGTVRQWWSLLTRDEQQRLITTSPASIGNLDGLPARVRSSANERVLDDLLAALRGKGSLDDAERRTLENCLAVRREIDRARAARHPRSRAGVVVQLLVFDPRAFAGDGRAAIAVGDVDTADHVAFLVPGLDASLRETLPGLVANAGLLVRESGRVAAGTTTAAVAWLGYDAPSLLNVLERRSSGGRRRPAGGRRHGGAGLALRRAAPDGHRTQLRQYDDRHRVARPRHRRRRRRARRQSRSQRRARERPARPGRTRVRRGEQPRPDQLRGPVRPGPDTREVRRRALPGRGRHAQLLAGGPRRPLASTSRPRPSRCPTSCTSSSAATTGSRLAAYRDEVPFLPDGINADPEADREPTVPTR